MFRSEVRVRGASAVTMCALGLLVLGVSTGARSADKLHPAGARQMVATHAHELPPQSALVQVSDAWVRPAVPGQSATGGFMTLTAQRDLTLVGFHTKVAGETELHDMVMDGDVMRMRALDSLSLPAGQPVVLRPGPGGKHLMLMGLKGPLKAGDELPLTLKLRTPDGKALTQTVRVPVQAGPVKPSAAVPSAPLQPGH
jgi:copper(I)-binding protein